MNRTCYLNCSTLIFLGVLMNWVFCLKLFVDFSHGALYLQMTMTAESRLKNGPSRKVSFSCASLWKVLLAWICEFLCLLMILEPFLHDCTGAIPSLHCTKFELGDGFMFNHVLWLFNSSLINNLPAKKIFPNAIMFSLKDTCAASWHCFFAGHKRVVKVASNLLAFLKLILSKKQLSLNCFFCPKLINFNFTLTNMKYIYRKNKGCW